MRYVPGSLSGPEKYAADSLDPVHKEEKIIKLEKGAEILVKRGDKLVDFIRSTLEARGWKQSFISDEEALTFVVNTPYDAEPEMAHAIVRVLFREYRKERAH